MKTVGHQLEEIVMLEAASLAGFFTAHAVWSVSDGETLIPIYGYLNDKNEKIMERLVYERLEQGVIKGQEKINSNPYKTNAAVLIYDGRISLGSQKVDALIIEFRGYAKNNGFIKVALPYTAATSVTTFAVHKPKVIEISENLQKDFQLIFGKFFEGVDQHEKGAAVWNQHLDESV
jgi:hypothetical protein